MGFQHMPKIVHEAASRKGGKIRTDKGIGKLSKERRKEIASLGGVAKNERVNKEASNKSNTNSSGGQYNLEEILNNIE